MGFEPSINQRLLPPTFPRFIRIFPFDSTIQHLTKLLNSLIEAFNILKLESFHQIFEFALDFSTKHDSLIIRSMLHVYLFSVFLSFNPCYKI